MSVLPFQLQAHISGCSSGSWCFKCNQKWTTLTVMWLLCTWVALLHVLRIQCSKQDWVLLLFCYFYKTTQLPKIPTKGLCWGLCFRHKDKRLQESAGLVAHLWFLMRGRQCPGEELGAHSSCSTGLPVSLPAPSHPSSAGTTPLPEHPQYCTEAAQPFTQPKMLVDLNISESWGELWQFGSLY